MIVHIKPYISVLKNWGFTKLWLSQVFSQLTNYLLSFAILIKVFALTNSTIAVAIVIVSFGIATIFFGFLAGVYSDRFDRKWLLTITNFGQMLIVASFLVVDRNVVNIAIITFLYSSLNQFYLPAEAPSIPDLVGKHELLVANSYFSFTASGALILGFALAGPLSLKFGDAAPFVVSVILLGLAGLATLSLPALRPARKSVLPHTLQNLWMEFSEGLKHFWDTKQLHMPLLSLIGIQIINGMLITLAPSFIVHSLGVTLEKGAFFLIVPLGLGVLVGALLLGFESQYLSKQRLIVAGFIGMGLMVVSLSFINQFENKLVFYSIVAFIAGIFNSHIFAPSHSILQAFALDHVRGRVYGALYVMLQVAGTLPTILVAIVADKFSTVLALLAIGFLLIFFGLMAIFKTPSLESSLET